MKTLTNVQLAIYVSGQDPDKFVKSLGECLKIATESLKDCWCGEVGCAHQVALEKIESILETKKR